MPKWVSSSPNAAFSGCTVRLITVRSNCDTIDARASNPASSQPLAGLGQGAASASRRASEILSGMFIWALSALGRTIGGAPESQICPRVANCRNHQPLLYVTAIIGFPVVQIFLPQKCL